jgi:hypothetical protein
MMNQTVKDRVPQHAELGQSDGKSSSTEQGPPSRGGPTREEIDGMIEYISRHGFSSPPGSSQLGKRG